MTGRRSRPRSRAFTSARIRAILSLGIIAGFGAVGTTAYWTDTATVQSGSFSSGSIDLKLDGNLPGNGGTYSPVGFTVANLIPGESYAWAVKVSNSGATPLTYKTTGIATGAAGHLHEVMQFSVYAGAQNATTPAVNSTATSGLRNGDCAGGTPAPTQTFAPALLATSKTVVPTARALTGGSAEWLCVVASLPLATANAYQTKGVTASFGFTAAQLGVVLP